MIAAQARALACSPRMGCSTSSTSSCSAPDR